MKEAGYIIDGLRESLESALLDAESRVREERYWLQRVYEGLGATLTADAPEVDIVAAYTLGFISDTLPQISNKIKPE